jgi:YbbR domain-containing protein
MKRRKQQMKKLISNIFHSIVSFIDNKIITPITKLVVAITSKFDKSGKRLERWLSKSQTLLFISLFLAVVIFIMIDQKILVFTDNTAEVLKNQEVKVIYNEEKYVIEGLPETVDITLIGSKTDLYIAKQSSSHYVTVDLSGLKPGTHKVNLQYNQNNGSIEYMVNPSVATVIIYEKVSETRTLSVDLLNQDSLSSTLVVENVNYDTDKIVIKGSEQQLDEVVEVKALVDLNNIPEQAAGTYTLSNVPLKAYNSSGEVVNVEIVPTTIDVEVVLSSPSKELPIKIIPTGDVASSYAISSLTSNETKVTVYGTSDVLNDIKYIPVYVNVEGLKENKTYKVELEKPVGIKSLSINNVTVSVGLSSVSNKKIENVSIEQRNLSSEYTANAVSASDTAVTVDLKGAESVISNITSDDVVAYIDLDGMTEGTYEVEVNVEGTDNKVQYQSMTKKVKIQIIKK